MSDEERRLHRNDIAEIYIAIAERFEHSAIFLNPNPNTEEETFRLIDLIRGKTGDKYFLMLHGDATYSIPSGSQMVEFSYQLHDVPEKMKMEAKRNVSLALERAERLAQHGGLDGFALCSDYCLNTGPFLSPELFLNL